MVGLNPKTQIIDGIEYELTAIGEVESNGHVPTRRTGWTAAELLGEDFADPRFAVDGLLPEGLAFMAGAPKLGKSWMALGLGVAIAGMPASLPPRSYVGGSCFKSARRRDGLLGLAATAAPVNRSDDAAHRTCGARPQP
jgi:hypothetical protein